MEAGLFLAALLLSCPLIRTSPVSADDCILRPIAKDQGDKVSYTTGKAVSGCVSRSTMPGDQEVHVLHVKIKEQIGSFQLNVSSAGRTAPPERKVLFVIVCDKHCAVTVLSAALDLTFVTHNSLILGSAHILTRDLPLRADSASGERLMLQVKEHYKNITSFTELENPHWIYFQVGKDTASPEECIVQPGFNARHYLQTEVLVQEVKHCTSPNGMRRKEAHILRVQQGPEETSAQPVEVKMSVVCPEGKPLQELDMLLVLQSQPSVTWNIHIIQNTVKILTSGSYLISKFFPTQINGSVLPDSELGLIDLARQKGFDDITSYADIPSASHVTLQLHRCEPEVKTSPPTSTQPLGAAIFIPAVFNLLQPWRCTDDSIEIVLSKMKMNFPALNNIKDITLLDTRCKAEQNKTHFILKRYLGDCGTELEGSDQARNKLIVTQVSSPEKVEVPFKCDLPQNPHLQLYRTQDFKWPSTTVLEVNKPAYIQVSFRAASAQERLALKECSLQAAGEERRLLLIPPDVSVLGPTQDTLGRELHRFSFVYSPAVGSPFPPRATLSCRVTVPFNGGTIEEAFLEVTLQDTSPSASLRIEAVVGITFAAFLIGTLLTAALWCIYSHTRPTAKLQPVSTATPASESSSTNHSIGSTQSTPCSTSSMA